MKRPKFSLGSWAFSFGPFEKKPWTFDAFLQYAADAAYDGVEINGFYPHPHPDEYNTDARCKQLLEAINDYGLGISGYAPDFRAVPPALVDSQSYLKAIDSVVAFCNRMEITTLRVDTVSPPTLEDNASGRLFDQLTTNWRLAAQRCAAEGVQLVWEFEPGFWQNKASEIKAVLEAVNHNNFKLLFDTSHAYMCSVVGARQGGQREILPGGVVALAQLLRGHIGHFHLIDSDGTLHDHETSAHTPFGQGHIDFVAVISAMRDQVESMPWWCFDFCFCPTTETDARRAIPFVEEVLRQIR